MELQIKPCVIVAQRTTLESAKNGTGCELCPNGGTLAAQTEEPTDATVNTACTCPANWWGDGSSCTKCADNSSADAGSNAAITDCSCDANFYGNARVAGLKCEPCNNGGTLAKQSSATATTPADCLCPKNFYGTTATTGTVACQACPGCSTNAEPNLKTCDCLANTYWKVDGTAGTCENCPDHSSGPGGNSGVETCLCDANTYGAAATSSPSGTPPVTTWAAGTYAPCVGGTGAAQTTAGTATKDEDCACLANYYPSGDKGTCTSCGAGYLSAAGSKADGTPNQTVCNRCAENYFGKSAKNGTGCELCPNGGTLAAQTEEPTDATVNTACTCPANWWGDGSSCTKCADNSSADAGSNAAITDCSCDANFYGNARVAGLKCEPCNNGGTLAKQSSATATTPADCLRPKNFYGTTATTGTVACQACPGCSTNA